MHIILLIFGIVSLIYFISIAFFVGHGTNFFFIWLFIGATAIIISILIKRGIWAEHIAAWIRRLFYIVVSVGLFLLIIVEGCIISGFTQKGVANLDYLIVLGAQMKANGPSRALQYRLDEAYRYLEENENTRVIVSGGQGPDEHISEAQGMKDYLVHRGISSDRILLEDQSENTYQNLTFSAKLINQNMDSVGVVTNDFHVFRAMKIAHKAGYEKIYGIAAKGEPYMQPNNMLREFFGIVKDTLAHNL